MLLFLCYSLQTYSFILYIYNIHINNNFFISVLFKKNYFLINMLLFQYNQSFIPTSILDAIYAQNHHSAQQIKCITDSENRKLKKKNIKYLYVLSL